MWDNRHKSLVICWQFPCFWRQCLCCGLLMFSLNILFLMLTPNHFHGSEWSFSVFVLSTSKKRAVLCLVNAVVHLSVCMLLCFAPHNEAQRLPRRWRRENSSIWHLHVEPFVQSYNSFNCACCILIESLVEVNYFCWHTPALKMFWSESCWSLS